MKSKSLLPFASAAALLFALGCETYQRPAAHTPVLPEADLRAAVVRDLNTLRSFPVIETKEQWQARAKEIREQIAVSCGLWPFPANVPLNAKISGKLERDGYSVEQVYFQTWQGLYLAGNLYRPLGRGDGPFPAILNPHGHWKNGRLADEPTGSIAGRCINFAKQGMVAFSYDMVGYNDTLQFGPHRGFALDQTNLLWNISLMGVQTWNSVRALGFLATLPDVDSTRLACTGESGGGTQTFMLGALVSNLAAQAPIVMVSHSMQGGCLCENAPGLRVNYSNMEIAAAAAPRPQKLVAATGDWTKTTMTIEGPGIASVYRQFNALNKLSYEIFDFPHNYNQTSREAVYPFFGKWLLNQTNVTTVKEAPFTKEPDASLRVFPDGKPPKEALNEPEFIAAIIQTTRAQLAALEPRDPDSLARWKETMTAAWRHTLQVDFPAHDVIVERGLVKRGQGYTATHLAIGRAGQGDRVPALLVAPVPDNARTVVVLTHPAGKAGFMDQHGVLQGLAAQLVKRGRGVLLLDTFLTGSKQNPEANKNRKVFDKFFSTYNRTDIQERVQDLITACAVARTEDGAHKVVLCGVGQAGLWALLAAPAADGIVADCDALEVEDDQALLAPSLFLPGIRRLGGFEGVAMLAVPNPAILHNTGHHFTTAALRGSYAGVGAAKLLGIETARMDDETLAAQIIQMPLR